MYSENRPKYESQQKLIIVIDKIFFNTLNKRNYLIKDSASNREQIISCDLKLSIYIKNRAKVTKGGFNFILKEMWDWRPFFSIDKRLLPKITINLLKSEYKSEKSNH